LFHKYMIKKVFLFLSGLAVSAALLAVPAASARDDRSPQPARAALTEIPQDRLPLEARETLRLIERGGPFPYDRDGIVFGNFEKRLPAKARGYYQEYTVKTPGVKSRGARRIIAGGCAIGARKTQGGTPAAHAPCSNGERYYTDDHYNSFKRVLP